MGYRQNDNTDITFVVARREQNRAWTILDAFFLTTFMFAGPEI